MRISQLAQQYTQQMKLEKKSQAENPAASPPKPEARPTAKNTDVRLDATRKSHQTRMQDTTRGVTQATQVRDGVAAVADGITKARALVQQAADPKLSAAERTKLQTELGKALAAVDQGAKNQATSLADKTLTNKAYDSRRTTTGAADALGKGASNTFGSVAALKKLDLTTASSDQLGEAVKVLDQAQADTGNKLVVANGQLGRTTAKLDTMTAVQQALNGQPATKSQPKQDASNLQALFQQQNMQVPPGSVFNTII